VYQGDTACNQLYPAFSTPRMVGGEPLENNVAKCQLRPINPAQYNVSFTAAEIALLNAIFPQGVCDYSLPGVGQRPTEGTRQFF
jgi:hypothetical protein